ncbi:MAG: sigma 54-interacting transcriptional regulator [Melioribacteraceae bacterium]|nr:MAG: sigma 54-interacting transcriptional regulator [Melioribacteraceae bacterium]
MIERYSKYILDSLAEGVFVVDKEFKLIFVNKAAEKLLGRKSDDFLGSVCKSFCDSDQCQISCPIAEVLITGKKVYDLEANYQKSDGKSLPVKVNASVLEDDENNPIGGIVSFRDDSVNKSIEKLIGSDSHFNGIVGRSKQMIEVFSTIKEIAESEATVLISGETGTGKELVANAIHAASNRSNKPFVKVNCAVLPENLLASELFGHVKGAFTDAVKDRIGRFELADGGTIFLDEIAEMPLHLQTQLLRILQEGTFERVGESMTRKIDVRVIAATNKNLKSEIANKKFREDLFYRLNVLPISIPPLREREDDILILAQFFVDKYAQKYNKNIKEISPDTIDLIQSYNWPGNVRELENAIEYSFVRSKRADSVCLCCLPPHIRPQQECKKQLHPRIIERDEKAEELLSLLRKNHWNKTKVAKLLGVDRSTIHRRLNNISNK